MEVKDFTTPAIEKMIAEQKRKSAEEWKRIKELGDLIEFAKELKPHIEATIVALSPKES